MNTIHLETHHCAPLCQATTWPHAQLGTRHYSQGTRGRHAPSSAVRRDEGKGLQDSPHNCCKTELWSPLQDPSWPQIQPPAPNTIKSQSRKAHLLSSCPPSLHALDQLYVPRGCYHLTKHSPRPTLLPLLLKQQRGLKRQQPLLSFTSSFHPQPSPVRLRPFNRI